MLQDGAPSSGVSERETLRIGVVAEARMCREAVANAFARQPGFAVAWTAADLDDAIAHAMNDSADSIVLDVTSCDSLRIIRSIREAASALPIIAFAAHDEEGEIVSCAEAGVAGFVAGDATVDDEAARG